jgi:hypothetical protein
MKRTKRFTLRRVALGLAVAALLVPAAQAKPTPAKPLPRPEIPYLSHGVLKAPVDFWNYDPKTGERLQNTSPGIAPEDLDQLFGVSSATGPDDRPFSKATSVGAESAVAGDDGYEVGVGPPPRVRCGRRGPRDPAQPQDPALPGVSEPAPRVARAARAALVSMLDGETRATF